MKLNLKGNKFLQQTVNIINEKVMIYLGEEFWGDLWEEYYKLIKQQKPKIIAQFITALNYLQFLWAKYKMPRQQRKRTDLHNYTIYKRKLRLLKKPRLPIITLLFMFLFVIFNDSNASNFMSDSYSNIPANTSQNPPPKYEQKSKLAAQAVTRKISPKEAEKKQIQAELRQLNAESKQIKAQKQQLIAENKQITAERNQRKTEAKDWQNKAKQKRIEAQDWLKESEKNRQKAQRWLRVVQGVRE